MSNDQSYNSEQKKPWMTYYKQTKNNLEEINISLLRHLEILDAENVRLKEAITEIHNDNNEKEISLDESHKIITKLNEELIKLMKEFKAMEQYASELELENKENKKSLSDANKYNLQLDKIQKQNTSLRNELEQIKKDNQTQKLNLQTKTGDAYKLEKNLKEKNNKVNEYTAQIENFESQIEERDKVISEYDLRFEELKAIINKKDEEIKTLLKISQEIGTENKFNVEELTKQAINTIKVFYNTINNNAEGESSNVFLTINPSDNLFISRKEIENILKQKKTSFLLEDALTDKDLYNTNDKKSISRQYLQINNLKSELLKSELFASLTRELNFVKYLENILPKNENILQPGESDNSINFVDGLISYVNNLRQSNEELEKEVLKNKKDFQKLFENKKELDLYIVKLKDNTKEKLHRMKERFDKMENNFLAHISSIKENGNKVSKIIDNNDSIKKTEEDLKTAQLIIPNLKKEISNLSKLVDNLEKEKYDILKLLEKRLVIKISDRSSFSILSKPIVNLNMSIQLNESFNEKSYNCKKEENIKLKNEIERLKDEITNIIISNTSAECKLREYKEEKLNLRICLENNFLLDSRFKNIVKNVRNLSAKNKEEQINLRISLENNFTLVSRINKFVISNLENENNELLHKIHMEENKSEMNCTSCINMFEKLNDFKNNILKSSNFRDLKQFYISHQMDIEKVHSRIDEVVTKFSITEGQFANENQEKKIKVSQVREILSQVQKLISLLSNFINKYNKDVYYFSCNLKKLFDFSSKLIYTNSFINSFSSMMSNSKSIMKVNTCMKTSTELILKMFYELNGKVFSQSDLKKIYVGYENRSVLEVIEVFKMNCENFRNNIVDKLNYDTEFSDIEDSFVKLNGRRNIDANMNNSYKIVNERILELKKFEFDFFNLTEFFKHYLVVQELIVKNLFSIDSSKNNEMFSSDAFKNQDVYRNRLDILNKIIYMAEDALFHKVNDIGNEIMFTRKIIMRLIKNQNNCLKISIENF